MGRPSKPYAVLAQEKKAIVQKQKWTLEKRVKLRLPLVKR